MKKILLAAVALLVLGALAFVIHQNLPLKRHARHMTKARLYAGEGNLASARMEYEKAYNIIGEYTPHASIEVLKLNNRVSLQDGNLAEALENTRKFVAKHPQHEEGWLMLADLALQSREPGLAFQAISTALKGDPGSFPARLLLARIRTGQGRLDLAEEQLRTLYESAPDSIGSLLPLAENLIRQGQVKESREFLDKALAKDPKNARVRMLILDGFLLERKADSAQAFLDAWQNSDPTYALPLAIRRANLYSLTGKKAEAAGILKPYLEKKSEENLPVFGEMALLHSKNGHYDSAIQVYGVMQEIKPATANEVMLMKTHLLLKEGNPAKALETLKILKIGERNGGLTPLLAATYIAMEQPHKVAEMVQKSPDSLRKALEAFIAQMVPDKAFIGQWALVNYFQAMRQSYWVYLSSKELQTRWPKSPLAITLYASNLASVGQHAAAADIMATLPNPTVPQRTALISLNSRGGRPDKAKVLAEAMLKEHPEQPGLNLFLADYHFSRKDKAKGVAYYEAELALDSNNVVALNNLAWEYGITRRDLVKARPYLERLRRNKANDPRILDTIGWILGQNGSPEGEAFLREALSLVPDNPAFLYHMGWVLEKAGKKAEAKSHVEAALKSKRTFEERPQADSLLTKL